MNLKPSSPQLSKQLPLALSHLITTGQVHHLPSLRSFLSLLLSLSLSHSLSLPLSRLYFPLHPSSATFLFNLLIRSFSRSPNPHLSLSLFSSLLQCSPSPPDRFTFPPLFVANASLRSPFQGQQTHTQVLKRGFQYDLYILNTLLHMYSSFGDMGSSRKLFESSLEVLDAVSWNTMIDGYVKMGCLKSARKVFDEMPLRNEVTWSVIINGYVAKGELDVAYALFERMPAGRNVNVVAWNAMVKGFARNGLLPLARKLFDEMPMRNAVSWNSIISGYALNGEMGAARELFDVMPEKDVVSWSCMISGYAQSNRYVEALQLFKMMQKESSVRPDEITMVSVLSACANLSALDQGKWIYAYIDKNRMTLDDDYNLGVALIDMYFKCGSTEAAVKLFSSLQRRNVSSWNALITGLAINGLSRASLAAFEEMKRLGTRPDDVTFLGVLMACTHGGLVDEGRRYFESMSNIYYVQPEMKHYGCMVDLLGRAGLVEEAEGIIRSMPMKPDVMILGALLGACRIHRDVRVADRIKRDFLEFKSQQAGCHLLLSNIYAAAGRWANASEMRYILKKSGITKEPGSSSVELGGIV